MGKLYGGKSIKTKMTHGSGVGCSKEIDEIVGESKVGQRLRTRTNEGIKEKMCPYPRIRCGGKEQDSVAKKSSTSNQKKRIKTP